MDAGFVKSLKTIMATLTILLVLIVAFKTVIQFGLHEDEPSTIDLIKINLAAIALVLITIGLGWMATTVKWSNMFYSYTVTRSL